MSRLGRVTPSAGRDVIDRKACFLSLLAQAAVWLLELRVSQHFSTFYGSSVQAMDTQLNARHRRGTPTSVVRGAWGVVREREVLVGVLRATVRLFRSSVPLFYCSFKPGKLLRSVQQSIMIYGFLQENP